MRQVQGLRSALGNWRQRYRPAAGYRAGGWDGDAVADAKFLAKLERLSLGVEQDLVRGLMGEHLARRHATGIEFADYRRYSPGDDLRRVDWNAYARLGSLHVRQAQAEYETTLYLLVDASPSMDFGRPSKFLAARRLAAALGYVALTHLDKVVLSAPGSAEREQPAAGKSLKGKAEAGELFRYLQGLRTGKQATFDELLVEWAAEGAQGRMAVVISDLLLDGYRDGLKYLVGAGFGVAVLHVLSPEELKPPREDNLELIDSETGRKLELHLAEESLAAYHKRLLQWLADTEEWCRNNGVGYLLVGSDLDTERVLLETLKRRGVTA